MNDFLFWVSNNTKNKYLIVNGLRPKDLKVDDLGIIQFGYERTEDFFRVWRGAKECVRKGNVYEQREGYTSKEIISK